MHEPVREVTPKTTNNHQLSCILSCNSATLCSLYQLSIYLNSAGLPDHAMGLFVLSKRTATLLKYLLHLLQRLHAWVASCKAEFRSNENWQANARFEVTWSDLVRSVSCGINERSHQMSHNIQQQQCQIALRIHGGRQRACKLLSAISDTKALHVV